MANIDRPNLFTYATSELSQDAFICWLAAWADPKFQVADPDLHEIARQFLISLINKADNPFNKNSIRTVDVTPQADRIDVLVEINKKADDRLVILIEDKTHTDHHHDQLTRYFDIVKIKHSYKPNQIIPIFFKTGYQSRFDKLGEYKTYLRKEFLDLLQKGDKIVQNAIYIDFLKHLEGMELAVNQFLTRDLFTEENKSAWGDDDWRGFFMHLHNYRNLLYNVTDKDEANWNYVANPAGGFFGFWWYFRTIQNDMYTPYLQLENHELCFKIEVKDSTKRYEAREEACIKLTEVVNQLGSTSVKRPTRMGSGRYMTVLRWEGDYREEKDGKLDFDATLENLKKAQQLLDTAFPK